MRLAVVEDRGVAGGVQRHLRLEPAVGRVHGAFRGEAELAVRTGAHVVGHQMSAAIGPGLQVDDDRRPGAVHAKPEVAADLTAETVVARQCTGERDRFRGAEVAAARPVARPQPLLASALRARHTTMALPLSAIATWGSSQPAAFGRDRLDGLPVEIGCARGRRRGAQQRSGAEEQRQSQREAREHSDANLDPALSQRPPPRGWIGHPPPVSAKRRAGPRPRPPARAARARRACGSAAGRGPRTA